ncbi:Lrp/AsnC family transcriptional regulator [Agromyces archimandritae]|uniref:Lrp/AsnC family transcriptional regulator n=1 Tax=Agromyces archimandritae TaxID=2781962 RepID=A0A975FN88_9MICO|nr:Lrp/AsnC family transcriptional regulator [Agromyces archimandritae]QTX05051.1 Lrp/AsnC family transcriptional regulator [Agromyces archimandritae]
MSRFDAVDRALLAALAEHPRATVVALADRLGLSRNTVQARMAKLEGAGVFLSFERAIDPAALGYPLEAFIAVHVRQKRLNDVAVKLRAIPEVVQAHGLSGAVDVLVRVVCRDAHELFRIDAEILQIDGVERTETSLAMGELIPYRLRPLLEAAPAAE